MEPEAARILLADDDQAVLDAIQHALERERVEIETVGDGETALERARDAEIDRVLGLELGADDYVTKPFSMAELVSRARTILRRRELDRAAAGGIRQVGDIRIDFARHRVTVAGELVHLTRSEFGLLVLLAEQPERVFSRREIMEHLWQSPYVGDERACDIHVSNLRRKIELDPRNPDRLVTVRGVGYTLLPAVSIPTHN